VSSSNTTNAAWDTQIKALRLSEAGKYTQAEPLFTEAIQMEEAQTTRTWTYRLCLLRFLRNYIYQERYVDALPLLDKLYVIYAVTDQAGGTETTDRIFVADCLNDAGEVLMLEHKYKPAEATLAKALRLREILQHSHLSEDRQDRYIDTAATLSALGRNMNVQKKFAAAQAYLDQASALVTKYSDPTDWLRCEIADAQIKSLTGQKKQVSAQLKHIAYGFYPPAVFDVGTKWAIYLKSAERIIYKNRKCTDCWWHTQDTQKFFEKAVHEAEKFGKDDMRLAGTLMRFGAYQFLEGQEKQSLPALDRALDITSKGGVEKLNTCVQFLHKAVAQLEYPSLSCQEDLHLLRHEIVAYKQVEGPKSKHAARLCKEYIGIVLSQRGVDDRYKAKQCQPLLSEIEALIGLYEPLTLQALSLCVQQFNSNMQYYDAMILQRKVVAGTKELHGPHSHEAGLALKKYAELLYETNDVENAKQAEQEAKAILEPPQ
jgi:tetratricopeptide (TPR) repeat protein